MTGYQVMPRLSPDEYADLEQSIKQDGVLLPIIVSEGGEIIDGHHRAEIAHKIGVHCPRVVKSGTPTELRTFAFSLNLNRRHLTREQVRDLIAQSLLADPQLSDREHGRRTGASDKTVAKVREPMERTAEIPQSATRISGDGRERPSTQPDWTSATDALAKITETTKTETYVNTETGEVVAPPVQTKGDQSAKPRSIPVAAQFQRAAYDLTKITERIQRITESERFPKNAEKVAASHRFDLLRARDLLNEVLDLLPSA